MLHWWKNNKKHIKYAENLSYTITFEVTEKAFELLFGGFDVCSERAGKTQGRSDRKCEIWRTPWLLVSNMWPVISLTAPVITGAAYSSALCELKLWASGSSDCSSESFIISPLMAECSVWAQSNTTIQLPDKKLTNLHLQHFYFPPPPHLEAKQATFDRSSWDVLSFIKRVLAAQVSFSAELAHTLWVTVDENINERMTRLVFVTLQRHISLFSEGRFYIFSASETKERSS